MCKRCITGKPYEATRRDSVKDFLMLMRRFIYYFMGRNIFMTTRIVSNPASYSFAGIVIVSRKKTTIYTIKKKKNDYIVL